MTFYIPDYDENGVDRNAPPAPIPQEPPKPMFNYDDNGEITGVGETLFANGVHVVAANATLIPPPAAQFGKARLFDTPSGKWKHVTDKRSTVVYDKVTKQPSSVDYLGDVKDTHTEDKPPSVRHKYVGGEWVFSDADRLIYLRGELMSVVDGIHDEAVRKTLGYKATPMQLIRYEDRYKRAKAGEFSSEINAKVIANHEEYLSEVRKSTDLIEFFRSAVDHLLTESKLDLADDTIKKLSAGEGDMVINKNTDGAKFKRVVTAITTDASTTAPWVPFL